MHAKFNLYSILGFTLLLFCHLASSSADEVHYNEQGMQDHYSGHGPQAQGDEDEEDEIDYIQELLLACFHEHDALQTATFVVKGTDGHRGVSLTFDVEISEDRNSCKLLWVVGNVPKGDIESYTLIENELVHTMYDSLTSGWPTEVRIHMWQTDHDYIDYLHLESLHPNNLVSGAFVKTIIWNIADIYRTTFARSLMTIVWDDYSRNREFYWLKKGGGQTYFEAEYDLEYECILDLEDKAEDVLLISQQAQDYPATLAFFQEEFPHFSGFRPIQGIDYGNGKGRNFTFNQIFIGQLMLYRTEKAEKWDGMTIRDALKEFIPRWEDSDLYDHKQIKTLAENTFMYFFRNHPNFTVLASQVLFEYDENCNSMRGWPLQSVRDPQLRFKFNEFGQIPDIDVSDLNDPPHHSLDTDTPATLQEPSSSQSHASSPSQAQSLKRERSSERDDENSEEHLSVPFNNKLHFQLLTFTFFMLLCGVTCRLQKDSFQTVSKPFNIYVEL